MRLHFAASSSSSCPDRESAPVRAACVRAHKRELSHPPHHLVNNISCVAAATTATTAAAAAWLRVSAPQRLHACTRASTRLAIRARESAPHSKQISRLFLCSIGFARARAHIERKAQSEAEWSEAAAAKQACPARSVVILGTTARLRCRCRVSRAPSRRLTSCHHTTLNFSRSRMRTRTTHSLATAATTTATTPCRNGHERARSHTTHTRTHACSKLYVMTNVLINKS